MRYVLLVLIIFIFKAGQAINKFDISETIGHSHKQTKKENRNGAKRDWPSIGRCSAWFYYT